ncbi:MAG: hypothetical protein ABIH21_03920 [Patescibacteria group bacterium]
MKTDYQKSNSIMEVDFEVSQDAVELAWKIMQAKETEDRQELGDALLDELADLAQIDIVKLKITDAKQYHKKRAGKVAMRQYGYYKPSTKYIYINNRTAVQGKVLAGKTFLNTLVHEWVHHYDCCKLGLNSIHTKGFYSRLNSLYKALLCE